MGARYLGNLWLREPSGASGNLGLHPPLPKSLRTKAPLDGVSGETSGQIADPSKLVSQVHGRR